MATKILVVECDFTLLESYCDFFVRAGFEVSAAATTDAFRRLLSEFLPDVLILEPDTFGATSESDNESLGIAYVPTIIVTRLDLVDVALPDELPLVASYVKPVSMSQLLKNVRNVVRSLASRGAVAVASRT